ncbi:efflux RND transporter periplasmic adaptor subunit [Dictyobacter formicarum]|uniref:RND transporter n=1 Tax=Dictyobacter formicarum TaxID=2778368 RepID=A0ABQ3VQD4_9CHLR|nr:efflux RND transporter periplasmic adaptor subunit [Dictyobacter formicarum]GHO87894.1 hypothetical protein KSZ_59000 [Dictyobacter formicarum]
MAENVEIQSQPLFDEPEEEDAFTFEEFQHQQKRKRPKTLLTILIILLVIVLAAGGLLYWRTTQKASISYTQAYVTTGNIAQQISATGPVQAKATYNLNFTTSGQINQINVKVGDQVKAGQQLATITPTNPQQNSASLTTLTAPANATVAAINGYVGTTVGSGSNNNSNSSNSSGSSNALIVLTDTSALQIVAQVNESDIGNVKVGQSAQFTVAAYPNNTFQATVASINTVGQSSSGVVTYPVTLSVTMSSLNNIHLLPLMTATANITTEQQTNVLRVPAAALTFATTAIQNGYISRTALRSLRNGGANQQGNGGASQQGNGSSSATTGKPGMVLELQNGVLTPVMVTTGLSNGQYTQILSGLNEGDQVVTNATGGSATQNNTTGQQRNGGFGGGFGGNGGFGGGGGGFRNGGGGGGFRNGGGGGNGGGQGQ